MSAHLDHPALWNLYWPEEPASLLTVEEFAAEVTRSGAAIGFNADGLLEITGPHGTPQDRLTVAFHEHTPIIRALCESYRDRSPRTVPTFGERPLTEFERIAVEVARRRIVLRFAAVGYEHPQFQILVGQGDPNPPQDVRRLILAHQDEIECLMGAFALYDLLGSTEGGGAS